MPPPYVSPQVLAPMGSSLLRAIPRRETRNAVFIGPAPQGSLNRLSRVLSSFNDFKSLYGNEDRIDFGPQREPVNWLALAARAFFNEGGHHLRVIRCGGGDGAAPRLDDYRSAFSALDRNDDFVAIAAPGASEFEELHPDLTKELLRLCERGHPRRFALLETPSSSAPSSTGSVYERVDSPYAATYYPWVIAKLNGRHSERALPPTGFIAGIIQRVDTLRGVHKAPANEAINSALGLERKLVSASINALSNAHVNCLRSLSGRGIRVWGARTLSRNPEWKYLNVRRLALHLEHSIQNGLQWVANQANDAKLWAQVRSSVNAFLYDYWRDGALLGTKPSHAYFVRCGWATMTRSDMANRRLRILVGFAPLKPAEFTVFQMKMKTGA